MQPTTICSDKPGNGAPAPWSQFSPFLFEPALLVGEERVDYDRIRNQILTFADLQDGIEVILLVQFVDNFWEGLRLKRLRVKFILSSEAQGVNQLLALYSTKNSQETAMKWMRGEKSAIRYVNSVLKKAGLDREAITAQTAGLFIEKLAAFDRVIAHKESSQAKALATLHCHREMLARRVSNAASQIEDAELSGVISNQADLVS